jgi:talin
MLGKSSPEGRLKLAELSKQVAAAVGDIVQAAEMIKGTDWVDPCDPTAIAETELLSAANSIEAAAKKLSLLQPRASPKQADESLNFEEQIVDAAQSIAAATMALVKAASVAQRELVAQGKIGAAQADIDDDSQWSQGLVSAARMVAAATQSLCEAANALLQGQASEEKLISSAKLVSASTAQLLVACMVKADPNSVAMRRLQSAGNAVKRATEALVREAKQAKVQTVEETCVTVKQSMVSDMKQIIIAQELILKKEKELEQARKTLEDMRKAKYQMQRPSGSEPTTPGCDP